jgi:hypothetical protein
VAHIPTHIETSVLKGKLPLLPSHRPKQITDKNTHVDTIANIAHKGHLAFDATIFNLYRKYCPSSSRFPSL